MSRNKCRICGYRFKSDDEIICPECFTARDEDSDLTLGDTISDEAAEEAFEDVEQRDFRQAVQAALAQLPDAQRDAIIGEFWFGRKPDPKLRREALRVLRHPRIRKPLVEFYR